MCHSILSLAKSGGVLFDNYTTSLLALPSSASEGTIRSRGDILLST